MEEYFCLKIQRSLKISKESYELCSDCRESDSCKSRVIKLSNLKPEIRGESLVCHYGNKDFKIPIPRQSMGDAIAGGLARILAEDGAFGINMI